jgi:hypothetical protein
MDLENWFYVGKESHDFVIRIHVRDWCLPSYVAHFTMELLYSFVGFVPRRCSLIVKISKGLIL